jgi:tRNA(fMet)-specific endonuclease VapC
MTNELYLFDTDHLSLYGRNHPAVAAKLRSTQAKIKTTVITLEEQLRGRLAQISEAKDESKKAIAYQWLTTTILLLSEFEIVQYDEKAQAVYQEFKKQKLRVGTQDLKIASITIASNGILLTRNLRDFEKIPGLTVQDWSI